MPSLACLWNRPRLERHVDGALRAGAAQRLAAHLGRCADCRVESERLGRLHTLVQEALPAPPVPDWSGFWPALRARLHQERPRPLSEAWWLPFWKPVWGHPRLALGGVMAAAFAATLSFWPGGEVAAPPAAWAAPVVVQDVGTSDPNRGVMVFSNPDQDVTVIWVFNPDESVDES
jgi:anti-sigma factor RsiW